MKMLVAALALLGLALWPTVGAARDATYQARADQLLSILSAPGGEDAYFSTLFLDAVPVAQWRALAADLRKQATGLRLPVQMIAGDQDGATPPGMVQATADLIPGAHMDVIPGAGHIPCVETPREYAAIITRFLKEIGHV